MNIVEIIGNLGKDPETRFTPSGQKVTTLVVACNSKKAGKEETMWWRVTVWGDRFDKMMTYLKKGSTLLVVGEMQRPEIYTSKEGQPQVSLELTAEMLRFVPGRSDRPGDEKGGAATQGRSFEPAGQAAMAGQAGFANPFEDEENPLPF